MQVYEEGEQEILPFKDFSEPDILRTGYIIPLSCGHNGTFSVTEKTIYEIHLQQSGFLKEMQSVEEIKEEQIDMKKVYQE